MDFTRISRRRVAASLALFALLGAAAVTAGSLSLDARIEAGPLPDGFCMAEARLGDRGDYNWTLLRLEDGAATLVEEHEAYSFEWLEPGPATDFDGRRHDANHVRVAYWGKAEADGKAGWARWEHVYGVTQRDRTPVSESRMDDDGERRSLDQWYARPGDAPGILLPCGLVSPFQGQELPLGEGSLLSGPCSWGPYWSPHNTFWPEGTHVVAGTPLLLLSDRHGEVHLWLDPAIPYPVRIAVQDQDDPQLHHVLRLTRFERGADPLPWDGGPIAEPPPPPVLRPSLYGLPSEEGLDHPFSALTAVAVARGHAEGARFMDILDAGGYVSSSHHREEWLEDGSVRRSWSLVATDGVRGQSIAVVRHSGIPPEEERVPGVPDPLRPPHRDTVDHVQAISGDAAYAGGSPAGVPREMPTVVSLMARWRAFAGPDYRGMEPNAWGHRILCDGDCPYPYVVTVAGVHLEEHSSDWSEGGPLPPFVGDFPEKQGWAHLRRVSLLEESDQAAMGPRKALNEDTDRFGSPDPDAPAQPRSAPVPSRAEVAVVQTPRWVEPAIPWLVGTGLAAAAASLVYLLWPAVKGGGLAGLFTRELSREALLEHPQRRRILAAVEAQPGVHLRELARRLDLGRGQLQHHAARLQAAGLLRRVDRGGYSCLFPAATPREALAAAGAAQAPGARQVLEALRAEPGLGPRAIARRTGLSLGTVAHHLRRLREAGLAPAAGGE